jgi:hypothetical protein
MSAQARLCLLHGNAAFHRTENHEYCNNGQDQRGSTSHTIKQEAPGSGHSLTHSRSDLTLVGVSASCRVFVVNRSAFKRLSVSGASRFRAVMHCLICSRAMYTSLMSLCKGSRIPELDLFG